MLGSGVSLASVMRAAIAQVSRNQVDVFSRLYQLFLVLGTIVGVIVIAYTLYNAFKYRTRESDSEGRYDIVESEEDDGVVRPQTGEIPTGAKGGKKVFLSFGISVVIVLGLIIYSYSLLLYVEDNGQADDENTMDVKVEGYQFGWDYEYANGYTNSTLIVPANETVVLEITSRDVVHNYGIRDLRAKSDAIPGQTTSTWFNADEPGNYTVICYELCGSGHSNMREYMYVVPADEFNWSDDPDEFAEWYTNKADELDVGGE